MSAERERMSSAGPADGPLSEAGPWTQWGPYVAERAWGTVREDYSPGGTAWEYFPHEHARSRAYRWNEDGMAGICDPFQRLCLSLALWNGADPFLKERMFGLTGNQGNHGEDVKEYWWYLDALPSHALLRWRYHYPIRSFPYADLLETNARRGRTDPEYELLDTGAFDDGMWVVEATYAKVDPTDVLLRITARNASPRPADLDVLPTLWFRNTWAWEPGSTAPSIAMDGADVVARHETLGDYRLLAAAAGDVRPEALFCDNETNMGRVFGAEGGPRYPKDGINDHVVHGADTVNPDRVGTKAAFRYRLHAEPGETVEVRVRLRADGDGPDPLAGTWSGTAFDTVVADREREADKFYADLAPPDASADEALVMRQAFAGMIWSKQYYAYDVTRWLDGDPGQPAPPAERRAGRNAGWRHLDSDDVLSMPDPWEYPWFAAWDLAFHTVVLAHVDPAFAKYQLIALCREWFMHPNGALPAYEWAFDDVNPPVHALAALNVYAIDGRRDRRFLEQVFHKLLVNFTWWVNRQDAEGNNLFEGGFLGLDNIGPLDRSHLPVQGTLEQSDATAWMAGYCLAKGAMASELADEDSAYDAMVTKFLEHFTLIARAMNERGLWNEEDGFFYDRLSLPGGEEVSLRYRSIAGLIPILAAIAVTPRSERVIEGFRKRFAAFAERRRGMRVGVDQVGHIQDSETGDRVLLSLVSPDKLRRILAEALDEESLLSPYGIRSLSRRHRDQPFTVRIGDLEATVDYEPAESTNAMFGGNSNWRGPVWFPLNHLVIDALDRYHTVLGDGFRVECPTGSGQEMTLAEVADELRRRLVSIFLAGPDGRRPLYGAVARFADDLDWRDLITFNEYFHGDDGAGLGATHQTGWTGLVAHMISSRRTRP